DAAEPGAVQAVLDELAASGAAVLAEQGFAPERQIVRRTAHARYVGQSSEISVELPDGSAASLLAELPALFGAEHERTYGFRAPDSEPVELMGLSVVARGLPERPRLPARIPPA